MNDDIGSAVQTQRQRKLDEVLFAQPFLSATMTAFELNSPRDIPALTQSMQTDRNTLAAASAPDWMEKRRQALRDIDAKPAQIPVLYHPVANLANDETADRQLRTAARSTNASRQLELAVAQPTISAEVMTPSEAAAYLRIGRWSLSRLMREEQLPCVRIGSRTRFRRQALLDWLAVKELSSLD